MSYHSLNFHYFQLDFSCVWMANIGFLFVCLINFSCRRFSSIWWLCPFVLFLLAIVLPVYRLTASGYLFGVFKFVLENLKSCLEFRLYVWFSLKLLLNVLLIYIRCSSNGSPVAIFNIWITLYRYKFQHERLVCDIITIISGTLLIYYWGVVLKV
jgi:hypothetical protein